MPQMAPMWWTIILLSTMLTLMMTIIINYFNYNKIIKSNYKMKFKVLNWTW
uniref:ATP synthase complex subunit 8 n=1 Tax=Scaphoideus nigrivalveus TaxID=2021108 RepID=A0A343ETD1_9HEMI|nr:ATP synthase F0 subunit 8 [Scaphoideus nigrivalveus]